MNVFDEFLSIARELERRGVRYALVGGVALAYHDRPRFTDDIDLLILPEDFDAVGEALQAAGYFESAQPWTFTSTNITLRRFCRTDGAEHLLVDVMFGPEPRHREIVTGALTTVAADGTVRFARKEDLIWMKRQRNSSYDRADIEPSEDSRMTKAERVFHDLSMLYEFNRRLQEWKKQATVRDPKAERAAAPSGPNFESASRGCHALTPPVQP